jgi:hypothetical protein
MLLIILPISRIEKSKMLAKVEKNVKKY